MIFRPGLSGLLDGLSGAVPRSGSVAESRTRNLAYRRGQLGIRKRPRLLGRIAGQTSAVACMPYGNSVVPAQTERRESRHLSQ